MNSEILISQAGYAIDMFKLDHDGTLCLLIKNGFVQAVPAREASQKLPSLLFLTSYQQKRGLSSAQWNRIGTELFNLYNKEIACQAHQKP